MIMVRRESGDPEPCPEPAVRGQPAGAERAVRWARRMSGGRPHLLVVLATLALSSVAWCLAHFVRFEFALPSVHARSMVLTLPFVLLVHCISLYAGGVFRILWPYVGIRDVLAILRGVGIATAVLYGLNSAVLAPGLVPRSVVLVAGVLTLVAVSGLFAVLRTVRETLVRAEPRQTPLEPVLIVGAGDSGDALLREITRTLPSALTVAGFIDDDPEKQGCLLRGIPVLGGVKDLPGIARGRGVRLVLIALPSVGRGALRRILNPLLEAGLTVKALPPLGRLSTAVPLLSQLKDVAIEDLLRREPIRLDEERIGAYLRGKRVLVTGAAGSIGSELCRKVLGYRPARLVAFDRAETPLHDLMLEIHAGPEGGVVFPELGDVIDVARVRAVFAKHAPDIVFHAAALKHVPVCESHPLEAIRVNVGGTKTVAEQALRSEAGLFVLISTDKAVNPSSVMGATKRVAELVVQGLNGRDGPARFAAVRFGNVLGSNGSVLRIFRGQLARGEPLTVTHPEMRRYFMTIPEAVALVLQAAIQAEGGEVFELDMGRPVRILDLAEDFIRLSGLVPGRDVRVEFTGVRPGEKLFEELYCNSETVEPTAHPKVFRLKPAGHPGVDSAIQFCLDRLGPADPESDPVLARLEEDLRQMVDLPASEGVSVP